MIATITGEIKAISLDRAVIEVGGVGLSVNLTQNSAAHLNLGTIVTFHTSLVVREESLTLYGFLTSESKHYSNKFKRSVALVLKLHLRSLVRFRLQS